jgi:hypothetical protein
LIGNELASLLGSQSETSDDGSRMNFVLDKFVGAFQQFSSNDNHRCSTITDFSVLLLSKFDKNLSGRMFDFKKLKDGGTIVTDGNVLEITTISIPKGSSRNHVITVYILTPISSTSILSNPTGPNELLTMLAIDTAAKTRFQIDDDISVTRSTLLNCW